MKKICVVTAARSEYGLLKWLMDEINKSTCFALQLVVTGGHLLIEQGHTIDQIIADGFEISKVVDCDLKVDSSCAIAESMGRMSQEFAKVYDELKPDYLLVLGDRYELLSICGTAFIMGIPIIHLCGGDVTEGAIDDGVRNAVTMMASYHFAGTKSSADNIVRMRGSDKNVWIVGEPGLDAFNKEKLMSRQELADNIKLDASKKWGLMTYHSQTKESLDYNLKSVQACLDALVLQQDCQTVITYANTDFGGSVINEYIKTKASEFPEQLVVVPSLGQQRYLSFMKQAEFVIGNSSSGIQEAPFLKTTVINIGDRQKGRYQCGNIIQVTSDLDEILMALARVKTMKNSIINDSNYWGDGHTSETIINILQSELI